MTWKRFESLNVICIIQLLTEMRPFFCSRNVATFQKVN